MAGTFAPCIVHQFFDNNGDPAAGHQLFTYYAGMTDKVETYTDSDLLVPNTNPIILDSAGRCTIYLYPTSSVKFVLAPPTDTDPPTSPIWTRDDIHGVPQSSVDVDCYGLAGEAISQNDLCYLSRGFGSKTAGKWYKADATYWYSSAGAHMLGGAVEDAATGTSLWVRIAGWGLTGSGTTAGQIGYVDTTPGLVTATPPASNVRRLGSFDYFNRLPFVSVLPDLATIKNVIATVGNVGDGEDTLASATVEGNAVEVSGQSLRILFWGKTANNANAKTINLKLIDATTTTTLVTLSAVVNEAGEWVIGAFVVRTAAATSRAFAQAICGPSATGATRSIPAVTQPTADWTQSIEIRLTGEATTDNDVTVEGGTVVLVRS
jgi:hypothetical protein